MHLLWFFIPLVLFTSCVTPDQWHNLDSKEPPTQTKEESPETTKEEPKEEPAAVTKAPTLMPIATASGKRLNIEKIFKHCLTKRESNYAVKDNKNGFLKINGMYDGDAYEGYDTFHLFRAKDYDLVARLSYGCGPACEQELMFYKVAMTKRKKCSVTKVSFREYFPDLEFSERIFFVLPVRGSVVYIADVPMKAIDDDPKQFFWLKSKYKWKDEKFVKTPKPDERMLPMTRKNIAKYFH